MTLRSLNYRLCKTHGPNTLHRDTECVSCAGPAAPQPAPRTTHRTPAEIRAQRRAVLAIQAKQFVRVPGRSGRVAADGLTHKEQQAVLLKAAGKSSLEIAAQLGLKRCAIDMRLNRARNRIGVDMDGLVEYVRANGGQTL